MDGCLSASQLLPLISRVNHTCPTNKYGRQVRKHLLKADSPACSATQTDYTRAAIPTCLNCLRLLISSSEASVESVVAATPLEEVGGKPSGIALRGCEDRVTPNAARLAMAITAPWRHLSTPNRNIIGGAITPDAASSLVHTRSTGSTLTTQRIPTTSMYPVLFHTAQLTITNHKHCSWGQNLNIPGSIRHRRY